MKLWSPPGGKWPWVFLVVALAAAVIQCNASWRPWLVYDRTAVGHGEWWRLWTGHLVHFGWPHFVSDVGLWVILGFVFGRDQPWRFYAALALLPVVITGALYFFDPGMSRYGGLSAVNLTLLLVLAGQGWQRDWKDWFWPAVLLIYVGELVLELTVKEGHGGGMIRFDEPNVHVATSAHIVAAACAVVFLLGKFTKRTPKPKPRAQAAS